MHENEYRGPKGRVSRLAQHRWDWGVMVLGTGQPVPPLQLQGKEKLCKIPGRVSGAEPQRKLKLLHFKGKFQHLVMTRVSRSTRRKDTTYFQAPCGSQKFGIWSYISVFGSSWNSQPGKSPQNRTVRFKTGHWQP